MALVLSVLVQHVPTYSSWRYIKNLYVKFSYPHMRNEECSYWEWPGLTDERTIFSSTWMCADWWSNCWPFCHPYPQSPYDGYNPSQFAALLLFLPHCRNYLLLRHCEYLSTCICLSCPAIVLPSSQSWFLHECLPFTVLLFSVLGLVACLSCSAWQCHNSKSVYSPSHQIIKGKKRNCPCIICGHVLLSFLLVLSLSHGLLPHVVPRGCLSFPKYTLMSYVYPVESQSFKILMPKRLCFFGMYCLKITLPLKETTSSTARFSGL